MRNDCVCHPARTKNRACACINARQYFDGIEPETWFFSIGGYQVLEKWLKDRKGHLLDIDDITHLPQDRRCGGAYARFYATDLQNRCLPRHPQRRGSDAFARYNTRRRCICARPSFSTKSG